MTTTALAHPHASALMEITAKPPLVFIRGDGSWLWDDEGRRYLDLVQGWAVNTFGHCPGVVRDALARQAELLLTPGPGFFNAPSLRLADALTRHSTFDRVLFTNSGAEANEGAIKLARKWGQVAKGDAYEIVTFAGGFHGRTLATMSASGKPRFEALFEPKVPGFPKATLNDIASVEALITDRTVAVMLEPIQGEAGVWPASDAFLRELRALTTRRRLLLIVDEIQTGMGRTGRLWAHQYAGIDPDIMTLGKMLGGGVPLAAVLAKADVCCFEHGDQGGTFNGNPLMTAVGCAVLDAVTSPGVLETVAARGAWLRDALEALATRYGLGEVRGRGLLLGLDLGDRNAEQIASECRERRVLINAPQPSVLRFIPALNIAESELATAVDILDSVLARG